MALAPELQAVEAWLTFIEVALGAAAPPIRLWVCRGLGGGVDGRAGAASAGGLGVQLWPAALTLAARAAELGASAAARSACELGCGVGLAGLAWLHATTAAKDPAAGTGGAQLAGVERRLVLTDGDSECLVSPPPPPTLQLQAPA